jgi:hypothetical protein
MSAFRRSVVAALVSLITIALLAAAAGSKILVPNMPEESTEIEKWRAMAEAQAMAKSVALAHPLFQ